VDFCTWLLPFDSERAEIPHSPPIIAFSQQDDPEWLNAGREGGIAASGVIAPPVNIASQHALSTIRHEWSTEVNPALTRRNTTAMRTRPKAVYLEGKLIEG